MCLPVKPYKVEREWEHSGLSCAVVMAREGQNRCGYVRVPPGHPAHGKDYNSINVEVHGDLTFAGLEPCDEHADGIGWWVGFDCAHCFDARYDPNFKPEDCSTDAARESLAFHRKIERAFPMPHQEHYWTQSEVEAETERLAKQLSILAQGGQ